MSETDHVGIIYKLQLVSEKRDDPNFIKTSTMTKTANPPSRTPTNRIKGNEANNHTHGEVPVQQRSNSADIQESIDLMLAATTEIDAEIAANEPRNQIDPPRTPKGVPTHINLPNNDSEWQSPQEIKLSLLASRIPSFENGYDSNRAFL